MKFAIGIDLGGTTIKGAVMDSNGVVTNVTRVPTEADKGAPRVMENIVALIGDLIKASGKTPQDFIGAGVCVPGFVDENGIVVGGGEQIKGWTGTDIYTPIKNKYGFNVSAANDVTAVALAELMYGAGRGVNNIVCFALGTGVGGGIVTDGKLYKGTHGMAAEIGHIVVETNGLPCNCGQYGCVERYASATGIVNMAKHIVQLGSGWDDCELCKLIKTEPDAVTCKLIYELAAKGDKLALRVNEDACEMLGRAIGILMNTMAPDRVILGGGVMMAGDIILNEVKKTSANYCWPAIYERCEIVRAQMEEDAGVMGAGALAFEAFGG